MTWRHFTVTEDEFRRLRSWTANSIRWVRALPLLNMSHNHFGEREPPIDVVVFKSKFIGNAAPLPLLVTPQKTELDCQWDVRVALIAVRGIDAETLYSRYGVRCTERT